MIFTDLPEGFGKGPGIAKGLRIADDAWDFCGWAVVDNMFGLGDGSKVLPGAFDDDDMKFVPVVWAYQHNDPNAILGNAILEAKPGGIYCYGKFSKKSEVAKGCWQAIIDGRIRSLAIYADDIKLDENKNVIKGNICEISLVYWDDQPEEYRDTVIEKWKEIIE